MPREATSDPRFADLTERIIYLRSIPVAAVLSPAVTKIIASHLRDAVFEAGSYVMREGQPIDALQFITSGRLSLVRNGVAIGSLAPPQTLGFLGILSNGEGTYDALADERTTMLTLDAEAMMELHEDHFELLRSTVHYLCERLTAEIMEMPPEELSGRLQGEGLYVPPHELDLVERMVMLRKFRAFRNANMSSIAGLARAVTEVRVEAGARIWEDGSAAESTFFLVRGRAKCVASDGRAWTASPTAALGGIEAVAGRPRWYALEADTPMIGLVIPVSAFEDALEDDFDLGREFMANIASQLVAIMERKAAQGQGTLAVPRAVSKLGKVLVGA